MANDKERQLHWQAAMWAIGHVLSREFECEQQELPDRIRQLLAELEAKGNPKNKDKNKE
jgi:hypothetical protein